MVILNLNTVTKHKIHSAEILNTQVSFFKVLSFNIYLKSHVRSPKY